MSTVLITGTSTGLGRLAALHFARQGWNVAATMRTTNQTELSTLPNVRVLNMDVTNVTQIRHVAKQAIDTFGSIDVVVNNAGAGAFGPLELASEDTIDWQFQVNVRGVINVIRAFLPHFRARRAGMFINISSYMGVTTAVPTGSLYNMSKFALEGLTEGLYYELKPLGIDLRLIEPGGSKDNRFRENMVFSSGGDSSDYAPIISKLTSLFQSISDDRLDDPQRIVDAIYAAAMRENQHFRTLVGHEGKALMAARQAMPIEQYLQMIASRFE